MGFLKKLFKKKKKPEPTPPVIIVRDFDIEEFNEWFKTEYDGYDGRKGCAGIFLRLDKFSTEWVKDYLEFIGQETDYNTVRKYYEIIREDWLKKLK